MQVTDVNGCQSAPVSIDVEITDAIDQPVITSSGPVCEGGTIELTTQLYSGFDVDYVWIHDKVI